MTAWRDVLSGVRTLASAALYTTLIVTFGFQVARADGLSMRRRCGTRIDSLSTGWCTSRAIRGAATSSCCTTRGIPSCPESACHDFRSFHPDIAATSARESFTGTRGLSM
jgi:hypothetical protein